MIGRSHRTRSAYPRDRHPPSAIAPSTHHGACRSLWLKRCHSSQAPAPEELVIGSQSPGNRSMSRTDRMSPAQNCAIPRRRSRPDRLITELTAHRTLALRNALANDPAVTFVAVLHNFVL